MPTDTVLPGVLLQPLARTLHNRIQAELTARGVQDLGSPLILFILKHRGQSGEIAAQRELADTMHISPATVAVSLKSLERQGMIEKRADLTDQRRKRIALTPKGLAAIDTCREVFATVDTEMFHGFSMEEQCQLQSYHRRMLKNLRGKDPLPLFTKKGVDHF